MPGQVVLDHSTIVFDGTKIAVLVAVIIAIIIIMALLCFEFADWFKYAFRFIQWQNYKTVIQGPDYKKILRLSYDVIITYDNRKSNLR